MHRPHSSRHVGTAGRRTGFAVVRPAMPAAGARRLLWSGFALVCGALLAASAAVRAAEDRLVLYSEFTPAPSKRYKAAPVTVVPEGPKVDGVSKPDSPKIDGDLTDAAWTRCPPIEMESEMGSGGVAVDAARATIVRVCRDDVNLYVAFQCREPAIGEVPVVAETTPDALCPENVRVYLAVPDASPDTFILGVDANGARYDTSLLGGTAWAPEWEGVCLRTPDGWTAEMAIPFKSVGIKRPIERETWRVNFMRCVGPTGERLAWEPTMGNAANADRWGMLCFGEADVWKKTVPPARLSLYPDRWAVNADEKILRVVARVENVSGDLAKLKLRLSALASGATEASAASTLPLRAERAYMVVAVDALPAGAFDLQAELLDAAGLPVAKTKVALRRDVTAVAPAAAGRVEIQVPAYAFKARAASNWPINTGVALPKGALYSPADCRLTDAAGVEVPCTTQVRNRWPADGSIRWLGVEFSANVSREQPQSLFLNYGPGVTRAPSRGFTTEVQKNQYEALNMYLMEMEDAWWINTGQILFNIKKRFAGVEDVAVDVNRNGIYDWTEQILGMPPNRAGGPYLTDEAGRIYRLGADPDLKIQIESFHEQRIVLRGEGRLTSADKNMAGAMGDCVFRLFAYAGQPFIRVQVTFFLDGRTLRGRVADLGIADRLDNDMRKQKCDAFFGVPENVRHPIRDGGAFMLRMKGSDYVIQNVREPVTLDKRGTGAMNWAGASGADRGVALFVRNMGNLHPKEIEFSADGRIVSHFWPPHGADALRAMPEQVGSRNVGLLGFAHYGRYLNLKAPPEFAGGIKERATLPDFEGVKSIDLAEPGGMALTYDMLYFFFRGEPDLTEIAEISRVFEQQPHAVQSHASLAASGALTDMLPPARAERAAKLTTRLLELETERGPGTGEFNYMDLRRDWQAREGRWLLVDYWMGARADVGAALWTLYMQTGRPALFTAAEANTRHVMSVDLCRSADPADLTQADPRRRKIAGAFGDHHTPVHWQGAWHVSDRHARIRGLLLAYYLTGNSLARDSATVWADAARRHGIPYSDLDGMAFLNNLADMLAQGYDPVLHDRMGECADYYFRMPCAPQAETVWTPGIRSYARSTRDPRAVRQLENAAAALPRDQFQLVGLLRDLEDVAGQASAGQDAQNLIAAFEKRMDALLGKGVSRNDAVSWQDMSAYVFGATEPSTRFAPKTPPPPVAPAAPAAPTATPTPAAPPAGK